MSSESSGYPGNQLQYRGGLIPTSLISENIAPVCENCEEFQEGSRFNVKPCKKCFKEYAYCFCGEICRKVTPGSRSNGYYEYISCNESKCEFLGVRCTSCLCLCKLFVSKQGTLFWGCERRIYNECQFFKQHVNLALRNHIDSCNNLLSINAETLCKFIYRFVDNYKFIEIVTKLYKYRKLIEGDLNEIIASIGDASPEIVSAIKNEILSPTTPNRNTCQDNLNNIMNFQNHSPTPIDRGVSYNRSSIDINELKRRFEVEMHENFNSIKHDFIQFKNDLRSETDLNFANLKEELTRQNEINFSNLSEKIDNRLETNFTLFRKELYEFKEQNQKNNDKIQDNFTTLFKRLKIDNNDDDECSSKVTRQSDRIKKQARGQNKRVGRGGIR